jgi:hypothetical protein
LKYRNTYSGTSEKLATEDWSVKCIPKREYGGPEGSYDKISPETRVVHKHGILLDVQTSNTLTLKSPKQRELLQTKSQVHEHL